MDLKRLAAAAMTITFALAVSTGSAFAAEKDDVVAAVHQYLASLEKPETASAMCDSHVSILDEFPPHEWHGPTACADWWKAYNAYNEKSGITDGDFPLGTPWTVEVTCPWRIANLGHNPRLTTGARYDSSVVRCGLALGIAGMYVPEIPLLAMPYTALIHAQLPNQSIFLELLVLVRQAAMSRKEITRVS